MTKLHDSTSVIPILSLFSGGGLLDLGFINQGFQIEKALEINNQFIEAYNYGIQTYMNLSDDLLVKNVKHSSINETSDVSDNKTQLSLQKKFKGIAGLIGGPPCQDYSVGGKNKGIDGERGKLIVSYLETVKRINPDFLFFENVEGLYRTKNHRVGFLYLLESLKELKYTLWFDIINPIQYGFPQDRPRIIVVGFKNKIVRKLVKKGYKHEQNNGILKLSDEDNFVFRWPKIKFTTPKAIEWPDTWEFGSEIKTTEVSRIPNEYASLMIVNAFQGLDINVPNQNDCFTPKSDKFLRIGEGDTNRKSFKRLHRFRYSPTVAYGNNEVHLHPTIPRRLTVREALRIQTVPDQYILPDSITLTAKYKIISNGVPTKQAGLIAAEIRKTLMRYYF